jgi:hypothetical protein
MHSVSGASRASDLPEHNLLTWNNHHIHHVERRDTPQLVRQSRWNALVGVQHQNPVASRMRKGIIPRRLDKWKALMIEQSIGIAPDDVASAVTAVHIHDNNFVCPACDALQARLDDIGFVARYYDYRDGCSHWSVGCRIS